MTNSVDADQTAIQEEFDPSLHCLLYHDMTVRMFSLTHLSIMSHKRDICKQCRLRSDATEGGVWSGSTLFALNTFFLYIKHGNNKNTRHPYIGNGPSEEWR